MPDKAADKTADRTATLDAILTRSPVIPVLVVEDTALAVPLAKALVAGGIPVLEITLRSNAALEAMACGVPVLGNPNCGHEELLESGVEGWISNLQTPELLSGELATLLAQIDSLVHCGRRARLKVEREFSLSSMAAAYDQLYRTVLPHS